MAEQQTVRWAQTGMGERRHEFLQADGRWQRCAGPGHCRECNRIAAERRARREEKR